MAYDYQIVRGVFRQTEEPTSAWKGQQLERLGLVDSASGAWARLQIHLAKLRAAAADGVRYKLVLFNRHGQGVHNVAARLYPYKDWLEHWGRLDGDDERTWSDAELTDLGIEQARALNERLRGEMAEGMPTPTRFYCSPLVRTASTLQLVYDGLVPAGVRPRVLESLRECVNQVCETEWPEYIDATPEVQALRKPYSFTEDRWSCAVRTRFPGFDCTALPARDELWTPDYNETRAEQLERTRRFLGELFADEDDGGCAAVSSHGGFAIGLLHLLGAPVAVLRPCELVPLLICATPQRIARGI